MKLTNEGVQQHVLESPDQRSLQFPVADSDSITFHQTHMPTDWRFSVMSMFIK